MCTVSAPPVSRALEGRWAGGGVYDMPEAGSQQGQFASASL